MPPRNDSPDTRKGKTGGGPNHQQQGPMKWKHKAETAPVKTNQMGDHKKTKGKKKKEEICEKKGKTQTDTKKGLLGPKTGVEHAKCKKQPN